MSLIESPLEWQKELDESKAPINMRGSSRFWNTVSYQYHLSAFNMDGAPEFSSISFWLDRWKYVTFFLNRMPMDDQETPNEQYIKFEVFEVHESLNDKEHKKIENYPFEKISDKLSIFNELHLKNKNLTFRLHQHIALELSVDEDSAYINYRFVEIPYHSSKKTRIEFQYHEKQYWLGAADEKFMDFESVLEEKVNASCKELDIEKEKVRVYTCLTFSEGKGWFVVADIWLPASQYFGTRKLMSNEDDL